MRLCEAPHPQYKSVFNSCGYFYGVAINLLREIMFQNENSKTVHCNQILPYMLAMMQSILQAQILFSYVYLEIDPSKWANMMD